MPRTRTAAAPASRGRKRKKAARPPLPPGWRTTDEDEIERRRQRAAGEPLTVEALEPGHPVFGTFRVSSEAGSSYEVEIRSLCRARQFLRLPGSRGQRPRHLQARRGGAARPGADARQARDRPAQRSRSSCAAPASGRRSGAGLEPCRRARAIRPSARSRSSPRRRPVERRSAGPPAGAGPRARPAPAAGSGGNPRSRGTSCPGSKRSGARAARQTARERFLAEVEAAPATPRLDVVRLPLYPYQQEGMLHLAFTERALLADEMGLGKTVQAIAACELLGACAASSACWWSARPRSKASGRSRSPASPTCPSRIIVGAARAAAGPTAVRRAGAFFYLANYEQVLADGDDMQQRLAPGHHRPRRGAAHQELAEPDRPAPSSGCAAPTPSSSPARRSRTASTRSTRSSSSSTRPCSARCSASTASSTSSTSAAGRSATRTSTSSTGGSPPSCCAAARTRSRGSSRAARTSIYFVPMEDGAGRALRGIRTTGRPAPGRGPAAPPPAQGVRAAPAAGSPACA